MSAPDDSGIAPSVTDAGDRGPGQLRDYVAWHRAYDDPDSTLSHRLRAVQGEIGAWLDRTAPEPVRVISMCAGDGRDLLGVLAERDDRHRVSGVLVEILPELAQRAAETIERLGLAERLSVRRADAGNTDAYVDAVPADLVIECGVMGNITAEDIRRLVDVTRSLCAPGATVIWTRGAMEPDLGPSIRTWFADSGFESVVCHEHVGGTPMRVGVERLVTRPTPFAPGRPIFTFLR